MATIAQYALSTSCPTDLNSMSQATKALDPFPQFIGLDLNLKKCLEKVERDCKAIIIDTDEQEFYTKRKKAFSKMQKDNDFRDFYCQNFKERKVNFDMNRICKEINIDPKQTECETLAPKEHEDYNLIRSTCNTYLSKALESELTESIKNKFSSILSKVIENYGVLHNDNPDILKI
jgi:hypothetical protein